MYTNQLILVHFLMQDLNGPFIPMFSIEALFIFLYFLEHVELMFPIILELK